MSEDTVVFGKRFGLEQTNQSDTTIDCQEALAVVVELEQGKDVSSSRIVAAIRHVAKCTQCNKK